MACSYCVTDIHDHQEISNKLSVEELLTLIRMLYEHVGIKKIRITGGEPLLYPHLTQLISGIRDIGISNIGMTSNGQVLSKKVKKLMNAGLQHINLSLDSLDAANFKRLGRFGKLHKTLEGVEAALSEGLKVKINTVIVRGTNDHEIVNLLDYAVSRDIEIRYLELMRMGPLYQNGEFKGVSMAEMLQKIGEHYSYSAVDAEADSTSLRYWIPGGFFGIIPNESAPFCGSCSRLRLTSDGQLVGCLSNPAEVSLRPLLTHPDPESLVLPLVERSVSYKQNKAFSGSSLGMSRVGG